jgi:type I restriction enzyme S subunit
MKLPETWVEARLGDICEINPGFPASERPSGETPVTFVPMSAVDEVSGSITSPEIRKYSEVAKGYTYFGEGDVLFAKITPCMENGKAAIAHNLENGIGFGSTEFHVFRPGPELLADYLHLFIRQSWFREYAKRAFTGSAGQQRVPERFFWRVKIPLPVLEEQQRIVKTLQALKALRNLRETSNSVCLKLIEAAFEEHFGIPELEDNLGKLSDLAEINPILNAAVLDDQEVSFLPMSGINEVEGKISALQSVPYRTVKKGYTKFRENDVLFSKITPCMENGKAAIASGLTNQIGCGSTEFHVLRPKNGTSSYFLWALVRRMGFRKLAARRFIGSAGQQRVPENFLNNHRLKLPTSENQLGFEKICKAIFDWQERIKCLTSKLERADIFILLEAYSGELTERWRDDNIETLRREAKERRRRGFKTAAKPVPETSDTPTKPETSACRESRAWLLDQLSLLQRRVLEKLPEWCVAHFTVETPVDRPLSWFQPLPADDADALREFCDKLARDDEALSTDHVKRALDQLAALGLIAKVSLLGGDDDDALTLTTAYRPLRDDERSQPADLDRLTRLLREGSEA